MMGAITDALVALGAVVLGAAVFAVLCMPDLPEVIYRWAVA